MRKKLFKLLVALTLLISILMTAACGSAKNDNASTENITTSQQQTTEPATEATTAAPLPVEVDLMMIGDMLVHEGVYNSGIYPDGTYNYDHLFKNILPEINDADISIVNQETILGGVELGLSGYPTFNSPYELGDAIVKAGFNTVLHATNHTIDKRLTGAQNCIDFWKKYPQIAVLGINETEEDYNDIYVYEKEGFKIAILNYTYGTNGIPLPAERPYVVNLLDDKKIETDVAKAKELADFVIICPHWGTEYVYKPDASQKQWTEFFLSLGVDLVLGCHPHVIEPVEMLEREDGHKMLVYYSLGNFVSNQDHSPRMLGAMAKVTLCKDGDDAYIKDYGVVPLVTQKLFGTGLITTYKLSDYTQELASQNAIRRDANGADFSLEFCKNLCRQVFGDLYQE